MRRIVRTVICTVLVAASSQMLSAQASHECTNASLRGAFGFKLSGTNLDAGLYALVGRFVADGRGGVTGTGTQSINGTISHVTFTAVYLISADCTGSALFTFGGSGVQAPLQFVVESDGAEVEIIAAGTDGPSDVIETGTAKLQFKKEQHLPQGPSQN